MEIQPDIIAKIHFLTTTEGGRAGPTPDKSFGCLLKIDGIFYDCRMLLNETGAIHPGAEVTIPIKFLDFLNVFSNINVGKQFVVWDGKTIGRGQVIEICEHGLLLE